MLTPTFLLSWVICVIILIASFIASLMGFVSKDFVISIAWLVWVSSIILDVLRYLFSKK